jgi:hypothetical protein
MPALSAALPALSKLCEDIHTGLRLWHKEDSEASPLAYLFLYWAARRQASSNRQATNHVLYEGLEALALRFPQAAAVLRLRFLDHQLAHSVANTLNVAESTVYALQKDALERLAETLLELERQARSAQRTRLESRLEPPTYSELLGVERHIEQLSSLLLTAGPPWLLSIEGIGGVGKTALADALMRHVLPFAAFEDFGWVTARQVVFLGGGIRPIARPALTGDALIEALRVQLADTAVLQDPLTPPQALDALAERLRRPHLIVVDNLETVQDIDSLLPVLRRLAGPSKFILTSRQSRFFEPGLRHFVVPELVEPDALLLLRREAVLRSLTALAEAGDDELRPIYQTVGGNPLALRLVLGQCFVHPLEEVLADLAAARGRKTGDLYNYVYRSSWDSLDPLCRAVLIGMVFIADQVGGTREAVAAITRLEPNQVGDALESLVALNLVNASGSLHERAYSIHQLTRRFLEHQVIGWQQQTLA